jgi:pentatricopeptide repeat protein
MLRQLIPQSWSLKKSNQNSADVNQLIDLLFDDLSRLNVEFKTYLGMLLTTHYNKSKPDINRINKTLELTPDNLWNVAMIENAMCGYSRFSTGIAYKYQFDLWNKVLTSGTQPTPLMYKQVLYAYIDTKDYVGVDRFFKEFLLAESSLRQRKDVSPYFKENWHKQIQIIYYTMLKLYSQVNEVQKLEELFESIRKAGKADIQMYLVMVQRYIADYMYEKVEKLFNQTMTAGIPWNEAFVTEMIRFHGIMGKQNDIPALIAAANESGVQLNQFGFGFLELLKVYGKDPERLEKTIELLKSSGLEMNEDVYCTMLRCYGDNGYYSELLRLWTKIRDREIPDIEPSLKLYNTMLKIHANNRLDADSEQIVLDFEKSGIEPDKTTLMWLGRLSFRAKQRSRTGEMWKRLTSYPLTPEGKIR